MIDTCSLYEACHRLFAEYPLAIRTANASGTVFLMVLLLVRNSDSETFFVLSQDCLQDEPRYYLHQWRAERDMDIEPNGSNVPEVAVDVITRGVPIPQDEHLFGWKSLDQITALIVFYTRYTPERPVPSWAVLPLLDTSKSQWPPFAEERLLGHWFWEQYRAGNLVSLDGIVGEHPDTVFWVNTQLVLDSSCCVVARDIASPEGFTLPRGRYVYQEALRMGKPVPSLRELLADSGKADLAPRFSQPLAKPDAPRPP